MKKTEYFTWCIDERRITLFTFFSSGKNSNAYIFWNPVELMVFQPDGISAIFACDVADLVAVLFFRIERVHHAAETDDDHWRNIEGRKVGRWSNVTENLILLKTIMRILE